MADLTGELFTFHNGARFTPAAIVGAYFRPGGKSVGIVWSEDDHGNPQMLQPPFRFQISDGSFRSTVMVGPLIKQDGSNCVYSLGNVSARDIDKRS